MCGICGYLAKKSFPCSRVKQESILRQMMRSIGHRGPDQIGMHTNGEIGLGFVRLSIIDLSSAGNQPMCDESKQYWIAFNGELFNYIELRSDLQKRGYKFHSSSDTEVVLKAYMNWGLNCFERFRGMWGLVIYDRIKKILVASRDYFGIKPLYFATQNEHIVYWSSEIKAFQHTTDRLQENTGMVLDYIQYGLMDHTENTFFEDVWQLRPGQTAIIDVDLGITKHKYWDLGNAIKSIQVPKTENDQIIDFKSILLDTLDISLRSDVPIWVLLSGGLDSSVIVSLIRHLYPKNDINAITVVHDDKEINEYQYAKQVAEGKNAHLEVVKINTDSWLEELHNLVYHQDEPVLSATAVNHWFLMKKLGEAGIKVIISGQGIDEVLYGYVKKLMGYHFADLIKNGRIVNLLEELFWHAKYSSLIAPSKQEFVLQMFKGFFPQRYLKAFKARFISKSRGLIDHDNIPKSLHRIEFKPNNLDSANFLHNAFFHLLTVESIPAILHYEDRNSMAFSIEQRVPFLDKEIISYLFSLPSSAKVRKGVSKWIFREALKGILPESVRTRLSKLSFSAPEANWITSPEFQNYVRDMNLLDELKDSFVDVPIFQSKVEKLLKKREPYDSQYWRVYNYALWKRTFGI